MPEQLYDEPDAELFRLLDRAAADTVPPTSFDVTGTLAGGRRRLTHRRRRGAAGVLAVAMVAAAVAVLPGLGETKAAPPAGNDRPTEKADRLTEELTERAVLARLLADRDASYSNVAYAGPSQSAVVLRSCGSGASCTAAVLLTADGWDSHVAHLLPSRAGYPWLQLMPDGAAAVIPDFGAVPFVLSPDGSTEPMHVSREPVPDGTDAQLVNEPPLPGDEGASGSQVWALNARERTLRPLANQPPTPLFGRVNSPSPGVVIVPIATNASGSGVGVQLAVSTDNGRSWETRPLPSPRERSLPGVDVGPGWVSLMYVGDGATIAPFEQLFVSADLGESWREVPAEHHPSAIGGTAVTPDGRLLIADHMQRRLWTITADGTDLEQLGESAPRVESLWSSGGIIAGETGQRMLAVTEDGIHWRSVSPGMQEAR